MKVLRVVPTEVEWALSLVRLEAVDANGKSLGVVHLEPIDSLHFYLLWIVFPLPPNGLLIHWQVILVAKLGVAVVRQGVEFGFGVPLGGPAVRYRVWCVRLR